MPLDVRVSAQIADLDEFVVHAGLSTEPFDISGFSFGGRVSMAFAAARPSSVRRLAVTSVSSARGGFGRLVVQQWASLVGPNVPSLESFAWSSILSTHHPAFLAKHEARVPTWVAMVAAANTREGLHAILTQTHGGGDSDGGGYDGVDSGGDFRGGDVVGGGLLETARACRKAGVRGKLLYGADDRIIDTTSMPAFAAEAGFELEAFVGCAHAVPLESPVAWRKSLLSFLDAP